MKITLIVAMGNNRVIGSENKLPWHLSEDLKRFRKITSGKTIIMGRKTHESIGKTLPDRINLVLSSNDTYEPFEGSYKISSIDDIDFLDIDISEEVFVIGGENVYKQFLPFAETIYLTKIYKDFSGDSYFPQLSDDWKIIEMDSMLFDSDIDCPYTFAKLVRKI